MFFTNADISCWRELKSGTTDAHVAAVHVLTQTIGAHATLLTLIVIYNKMCGNIEVCNSHIFYFFNNKGISELMVKIL